MEEVSDVLVIDFEVGYSNTVGYVCAFVAFYAFEEVFAGSRYEAWLLGRAHHRVGLPRTSLAICENAGVITLEIVVQELFTEAVVYFFLVRIVLVF